MEKITARKILEDNYNKLLKSNPLYTDYSEDISIFSNMTKADFIEKSDEAENEDANTDGNADSESKNASNFWSMINAYGAEEIFDKIDTDSDGVISEKEISIFNKQDGNDLNLSIYDLQDIFEEINDADDQEMMAQPAQSAPSVSRSGGFSGGAGSGQSISSSGNSQSSLKTASDYEAAIDAKESEKNEIKANTQDAIQTQEKLIEDALSSEDSGISEEVMNEYIEKTKEYDTKIEQTDQEIESQKTIVQDSTAQIAAQTTAIQKYASQISSLESSKSSEPDADNSEIETKISNLMSAKSESEGLKAKADADLKAAEKEIARLEDEKEKLQEEKSQLKTDLIENNKENMNPAVLQVITDAQAEIKNLEANEKTQIAKIDSEIQTLKTELAEVKQNEKTEKVVSENSTFPITDEQLAEYGFDTADKREAWNNLTPEMKEAVVKLTDYATSKGIKISYSSATCIFRTYEEQAYLYQTKGPGWAAKPGTSRHESGMAVDINLENQSDYAVLGEYWSKEMGFTWGGNWSTYNEPWHFDIG